MENLLYQSVHNHKVRVLCILSRERTKKNEEISSMPIIRKINIKILQLKNYPKFDKLLAFSRTMLYRILFSLLVRFIVLQNYRLSLKRNCGAKINCTKIGLRYRKLEMSAIKIWRVSYFNFDWKKQKKECRYAPKHLLWYSGRSEEKKRVDMKIEKHLWLLYSKSRSMLFLRAGLTADEVFLWVRIIHEIRWWRMISWWFALLVQWKTSHYPDTIGTNCDHWQFELALQKLQHVYNWIINEKKIDRIDKKITELWL